MDNNLVVTEAIEINKNIEEVWKGLTTPSIIKEYLFGTIVKTDWRPGSPITFEGEYNGIKYHDKGMIKSFKPFEEISYSYWSSFSGLDDAPENYSLVTYKLNPINHGHTEFTWIQKGFADESKYNHSKNGMPEFLKKLKEVIEGF